MTEGAPNFSLPRERKLINFVAALAPIQFPLRVSTSAFILQLIILATILLDIPLLRPVLGFFYVGVFPGLLIVYLSGMNSGPAKAVLYAIGLSMATVMLLVAGMNLLLPSLGIRDPITQTYLLLALSILVTALCILIRVERDTSLAISNRLRGIRFPDIRIILLSCILPATSILGTITVLNNHGYAGTNIVLMFLLAAIPFFAIFAEERRGTILLIWATSIALLLNVNLVSGYVWGWDIHRELFVSNQVLQANHWDINYSYNINTMLTYAVLAPSYSTIMGIKLVWVFKLVYPLLFSVVPVGIYYTGVAVFKKRKVATLAPFVFMFYYGFFKNMPHKQYLAEIPLIILLMVVFSEELEDFWKRFMMILLIVGIVVSHYGTAFFLIALLGATGVLIIVLTSNRVVLSQLFNPRFIILASVIFGYWYLTVGSGIMAKHIVGRFMTTLMILSEILTSPPTRSGAGYVSKGSSTTLWLLYKLMSVALVGLVGVGVTSRSWDLLKTRVKQRNDVTTTRLAAEEMYTILGLIAFGLTAMSVVLTFGMGFDRLFQFTLVFLAPFFVIGVRTSWTALKRIRPRLGKETAIYTAAAFLMVYFVLSSGAGFAMFGSGPPPYSVSLTEDNSEWRVYSQAEVASAEWIAKYNTGEAVAVSDPSGHMKSRDPVLLLGKLPPEQIVSYSRSGTQSNLFYSTSKIMVKKKEDSYHLKVYSS